MKLELRPYQLHGVERIRDALRSGMRAPLAVAPTGAGKTVLAAHIIEQSVSKGKSTLFLAHRKELIDQPWNKLKDLGITAGVIKADDWRTDYACPVQVASVQTMIRRLDLLRELNFDMIFTDEAHHGVADSYTEIYKAYPDAIRLGLTATPYRSDGKGLKGIFDCIIEVATVEQLIKEGYLVKPRVFVGDEPDLSGVGTTAGDYNKKQLERALDKPKLVGNIIETWARQAPDLTTVAFCVGIEHSKRIQSLFLEANIRAEHLDGKTPDTEREAILGRLATGETTICCNVGVLTEGWDLPRTSCIILARPTKSRGLWRQMAGRGLRPHDGKKHLIILDHANCHHNHGSLTDPDEITLEHGCKRKAFYGDPEEREFMCPNLTCKAVLVRSEVVVDSNGDQFCPHCGAEIERLAAEPPEADESQELREVVEDSASIRQTFYKNLINMALAKRWRPGAVRMKFKDRFGRFPRRVDEGDCSVRVRWSDEKSCPVFVWSDGEEFDPHATGHRAAPSLFADSRRS